MNLSRAISRKLVVNISKSPKNVCVLTHLLCYHTNIASPSVTKKRRLQLMKLSSTTSWKGNFSVAKDCKLEKLKETIKGLESIIKGLEKENKDLQEKLRDCRFNAKKWELSSITATGTCTHKRPRYTLADCGSSPRQYDEYAEKASSEFSF